MENLTQNITNDEEVLLGDFDYPLVNLDTLPIILSHNKWGSVLAGIIAFIFAVGFLILFLLVGIAFLKPPQNNNYLFIILAFFAMFICSAIVYWQYVVRFLEPTYLAIYTDRIEVRVNNFRKNLQIVYYDNLYGAFSLYFPMPKAGSYYATVIAYIMLSDDRQSYTKDTLKFYPKKAFAKDNSLYMTAIIRTAMQAYHQQHNLTDKLPKFKVIRQK